MGAITDMATALAGSGVTDLENVSAANWVGRAPMAVLASREAETLRWGRRWLDVARARHLDRGRDLDRLGVSINDAAGVAVVGGGTGKLLAPDCVVTTRPEKGPR